MPKGSKRKDSHLEKVYLLSQQLSASMIALVEHADSPEFKDSALKLKQDLQIKIRSQEMPKEFTDIQKLLETYPGLAPACLSFLKGKINEYTSLEVLEKYKQLSVVVTPKRGKKKAAALSSVAPAESVK